MGHRVSLLHAARGREGHIHRRGGEGHTRIGPAMLAYNCHSSDGGVFCISRQTLTQPASAGFFIWRTTMAKRPMKKGSKPGKKGC